jgi:hypothetical protein
VHAFGVLKEKPAPCELIEKGQSSHSRKISAMGPSAIC